VISRYGHPHDISAHRQNEIRGMYRKPEKHYFITTNSSSMKDKGELYVTRLNETEAHNPLLVLQAFTEDFSLESVRQLVDTMRDVCITTENVLFGNAVTREDLPHVTRHIIRFYEAAYLYLGRLEPDNGQLVVHDFSIEKPIARPKLMMVQQRTIPSRYAAPYIFPWLTLSGNWMEKAGFHPGDQVSVSHAHQKILITVYRKWDEAKKEFKRA
jgi:hypothetical protein